MAKRGRARTGSKAAARPALRPGGKNTAAGHVRARGEYNGAWGWERMRKGFQVALSIAISALLVGAALLSLLTLLRGALSSEALRRALEALAAFSGAR